MCDFHAKVLLPSLAAKTAAAATAAHVQRLRTQTPSLKSTMLLSLFYCPNKRLTCATSVVSRNIMCHT